MIERVYDFREAKRRASWNIIVSSKVIYLKDGDDGFWGFVPYEDQKDVFEVHVDMSTSCRGKLAKEKCKNVLSWVFTHTDIAKVIGQIPAHNRKACFNAVSSGLSFSGLKENGATRVYELRK